MKTFLASFVPLLAFLAIASHGQVNNNVEPVKICSIYGAAFYYIPGTDVCTNAKNGDTRQQTAGGTWRSVLPYKQGQWVTNPQQECGSDGRLVRLGKFKSTDFTLNAYEKFQSYPVPLHIKPPEFITKVMMSGGFYDPRLAGGRDGTGLSDLAFCVRSIDPTVLEKQGNGAFTNPAYGLGFIPLGCIANSRIAGMPAAYAIPAGGAYPQIDVYAPGLDPSAVAGPYTYGSELVVTTDILTHGRFVLSYAIPNGNNPIVKPLAGMIAVSVCVSGGSQVDDER